jgi:hypothetical protein
MEGDGEAEDLDWMNEETYCAISSTPVTKLSSDGNYRLPTSSYGINKTDPSVRNDIHLYNLSSQIMKQEKNLPQTILRETQAYTLMPEKDPSRGGDVTASYLNFNVNEYSTLTQPMNETSYYEALVNSKSEEKAPNKRKGSAEIHSIIGDNNDSFW